jgi:hypothetical protein
MDNENKNRIMNRLLTLLLIAGLTFLVVLFIARPDLLDGVWLWVVGLSGAIVKAFDLVIDGVKSKLGITNDAASEKEGGKNNPDDEDKFEGITLKLLRYHKSDGLITGLLFINDTFYCYAYETLSNGKIIPPGIHKIKFTKEETGLTGKYRILFPEFFTGHIQIGDGAIQNTPLILAAGDYGDVYGLTVFSSLNAGSRNSFLNNSRETYRRLYKYLDGQIQNKIMVRMIIYDDSWVKKLK